MLKTKKKKICRLPDHPTGGTQPMVELVQKAASPELGYSPQSQAGDG